ncbi:hypothetical protein DPMN_166199 [Dreissena polymorpha]|uniref:Uncharacterized protein n=1 Tax=Dreissena polymorpha TaxID=45954 RepID=A0A9D4EYJ5_DREPO|nr:hypothetical protein DPMN_166199 [Dreissena polymorpha]
MRKCSGGLLSPGRKLIISGRHTIGGRSGTVPKRPMIMAPPDEGDSSSITAVSDNYIFWKSSDCWERPADNCEEYSDTMERQVTARKDWHRGYLSQQVSLRSS